MLHKKKKKLQIQYVLQNGAEINQRDDRGFTPLHRAAYLFQYDGYPEIYEYLLVRPGGSEAILPRRTLYA